jgi:hypothetical protein
VFDDYCYPYDKTNVKKFYSKGLQLKMITSMDANYTMQGYYTVDKNSYTTFL